MLLLYATHCREKNMHTCLSRMDENLVGTRLTLSQHPHENSPPQEPSWKQYRRKLRVKNLKRRQTYHTYHLLSTTEQSNTSSLLFQNITSQQHLLQIFKVILQHIVWSCFFYLIRCSSTALGMWTNIQQSGEDKWLLK